MKKNRLKYVPLCLMLGLFAGCDSKPKNASQPARQGPPYVVDVIAEEGIEVGQKSHVQVSLKSQGKWHVNQDYPIKLELETLQGLKVEKDVWNKADVKKMTETEAVFEVPFTPEEVGQKELNGVFSFAVCTDDSCLPDEKKVSVTLNIVKK